MTTLLKVSGAMVAALILADATFQVPFLEYGALGLCAAMVVMNHLDRRELVKDVREMREQSWKVIELNTAAFQGVKDVIEKCKRKE